MDDGLCNANTRRESRLCAMQRGQSKAQFNVSPTGNILGMHSCTVCET